MFEEFASVVNLGDYIYKDFFLDDEELEYKKRIGSFHKHIRAMSKQEECFLCHKQFTSFCNSHSVPAFVLRNIAINGEVLTPNSFIQHPALKNKKGVNQAGTFNLICRECDSKIFSDYENPENYNNEPTQKMLAQIALKNNLMYISKRNYEINLFNQLHEEFSLSSDMRDIQNNVKSLDLKDYFESFQTAKKAISLGNCNSYYLCYYNQLDYVVPIAFQSSIALISDFKGQTINDTFNMSASYKIKTINICVFPLDDKSVIFMFIENGDKRYRNFYREFNKLDKEDQLLALTYILFLYSEEVYLSKSIPSDILKNQNLINTCKKTIDVLSPAPNVNALQVVKKNFNLSDRFNIPNLLSEKYKVR